MAEAYGLQNAIGDGHRTNAGVGASVGNATSPTYGVARVGTGGGVAGNCIYSVVATSGDLIVSEFFACVGVVPTVVAPILKFWRRPDGAQTSLAPGGTGDIAMTPATMTIPLLAITGNCYVIRFTANNVFNPGEAFIVEIDTIDTGAAATATLGHSGYYVRFNADSIQSTAGAAKPNTSAVGRVFVVTA
jgi:hypothetical protein